MPLPLAIALGFGFQYGLNRLANSMQEKSLAMQGTQPAWGQPPQEMAGPVRPNEGPLMSQGSGLFYGADPRQTQMLQTAQSLVGMGGKHAEAGKAIISQYLKESAPWTPPNTVFAGGAQGDDSRQQKYMFGPDGNIHPVAPSYKPGSAASVTINPAEEGADVNDIKAFTNDQGQHPGHLFGLSKKDLATKAQEQGYKMQSTLGEKSSTAESNALNILDTAENLLFGDNGLYEGYGEFSKKLSDQFGIPEFDLLGKLGETFYNNYQLWAQDDIRYKNYNDFKEASLAPLVRSMGESGALANEDIERARGALPSISGLNIDTKDAARNKMDIMRGLISKGKSFLANKNPGDTWTRVQNGQTIYFRMMPDRSIQKGIMVE